jgi:GNAT superfamily N-acetyltransferase
MDIAARVLRTAFDHALPSLTGLHTPAEDQWFFRERVFKTCTVWGAFDSAAMIGMLVFREDWIDQLYVLPKAQGRGVGSVGAHGGRAFRNQSRSIMLPRTCVRPRAAKIWGTS